MPQDLPPPEPRPTETLVLPDLPRRDAIDGLCGCLEAMLELGAEPVVDATNVRHVDAVTVETVARLALVARRRGQSLRVVASPALRELLALAGLTRFVERPA